MPEFWVFRHLCLSLLVESVRTQAVSIPSSWRVRPCFRAVLACGDVCLIKNPDSNTSLSRLAREEFSQAVASSMAPLFSPSTGLTPSEFSTCAIS